MGRPSLGLLGFKRGVQRKAPCEFRKQSSATIFVVGRARAITTGVRVHRSLVVMFLPDKQPKKEVAPPPLAAASKIRGKVNILKNGVIEFPTRTLPFLCCRRVVFDVKKLPNFILTRLRRLDPLKKISTHPQSFVR